MSLPTRCDKTWPGDLRGQLDVIYSNLSEIYFGLEFLKISSWIFVIKCTQTTEYPLNLSLSVCRMFKVKDNLVYFLRF